MRWFVVLALAAASLCQAAPGWILCASISTTKGYVVGAKLLPSGVFCRGGDGDWKQLGHLNPFSFAIDYDKRDPSRIYNAAGNGIIRLTPGSRSWRILTGSDVTEMRDVVVGADGSIYYGYAAGVRVSRDQGATWTEIGGGLRRKYTEVIRIDSAKPRVLFAGTEAGVFRSDDDGDSWKLAGAQGYGIMDIAQSPHDACFWLAATERGGLFASRDCGVSFENLGRTGFGSNLYNIAFDPTTKGRIAVAGWGPGVQVSEDNGRTWSARNAGLPSTELWSVIFDPVVAGKVYAGVHEESLFVSTDAGRTWKRDSLQESVITRMKFIPEAK